MNAVTPVGPTLAVTRRRNSLENIVLQDRTSLLFHVLDEDAAYVVGHFADIRGQVVNSRLSKIDKTAILLRVQVKDELRPDPDSLTYSHRKADLS